MSRIQPLHLIYRDEGKTEWKINPQAASRLQQIQGDIGIIAIIGQYRTGKSYILNRLAGQSNGFALGHTVKGCTRGIWMWGEPVRLGNLNVILLDVEGLSDPMREDSKDDDVLFTLSVLLSSLFIINTTGTIDAKKFEALQVATNLSERIRVHGSDEEPNSLQIAEQMPYLLWLVRDFTLELTSDMRTDDDYLETCLKETPYKPGKKVMSADQVKQCIKLYFPRRGCVTAPAPTTPEQMGKLDTLPLESLNPKFRQKMKEIIDKISKEVTPKRLGSSKGSMLPVDGAGLVSMMTNYVTAINKGALPDVENAWQLLQKSHCAEAVNGAKKAFMAALERGRAKFVGTENRALDVQEFESVSAEAFKEAHEYFKKHAVGEPKTTATFLEQLGTELATYKEGKDGLKTVKGGLLKEFADKNYKLALTTGEEIVNQAINTLSETQYPDFEAFKVARERVAQELGAKLQKSVAFPELSERYLEALNNLSTKKGLQFEISAAEKEKERILAEQAQKDIENEKKNAELMEALANRRQAEVNVHRESDFLREQSEREYLEMKRRFAEEAKLREQQIQADRRGGFDVRADALQKELQDKTQETIRQLMMMQKEANDRQAALTERLLMMQQQPIPQPRPQPRQGGLLTGLLAPVTGLVDNLLGGLGLGQVLAPVTNLVDGVVNPLVNTVGGVTQPVVGAVGGLTTPVMQGVGGLTSPLTNTVGGLTQPLTKTVGGLTGGLGGTVGGLTGGLSSGLGNTFDTVGGLTSSALPYRSHGMI